MNDADVSKQMERLEAEEKANEISVSAEEEFNTEKLQLVEPEKKKIRQGEFSTQLNASQIKVLLAQASKELLNVSLDHHVYRKQLRDLAAQVPEFYYCSSI